MGTNQPIGFSARVLKSIRLYSYSVLRFKSTRLCVVFKRPHFHISCAILHISALQFISFCLQSLTISYTLQDMNHPSVPLTLDLAMHYSTLHCIICNPSLNLILSPSPYIFIGCFRNTSVISGAGLRPMIDQSLSRMKSKILPFLRTEISLQ